MSRLQDHFVAEQAAPLSHQLEAMLASLVDGVDHPEIWRRLAELGESDEAEALVATLDASWTVVPVQFVKPLQTARAVVVAVSEDRAIGLRLLKALEGQVAMCPQIAGASLFVSRLGDPDRTADLSERFCASPFRH